MQFQYYKHLRFARKHWIGHLEAKLGRERDEEDLVDDVEAVEGEGSGRKLVWED